MVKNLPATAGDIRDPGSIPGWGRSPGGGNGNPLSVLAWRIPWTERSLVGYSPWGHKELDKTEHIIVLRHLMYRRHNLNVENQSQCGDSFLKISYKLCVCVFRV